MTTTKASKVQTLMVNLETTPGSLHKVYQAFREANINAEGSWAYEMGPEEAHGIFVVNKPDEAKQLLESLGKTVQSGWACKIEGNDTVGAYEHVLAKIAHAGLNVNATDALAIDGKFSTIFFVKDEDVEKLCNTLGC